MSTPLPPDDERIDRREVTVTQRYQPVENDTTYVERREYTAPAEIDQESIAVDYGAERQAALHRISQFISFLFGLIVALIVIRVLLRLIAANPDNPFAQLIYGVTAPFLAPFATLTGTPTFDGAALEVSSIIAAIIYALIGWALVKLVWMLFYRPSTRSVRSSSYRRV